MMTASDWEARYQSQDTPWDKGEASPGLAEFLATRLEPGTNRGRVAVPGCGTGHDVRAWAKAGFDAWGFDLAPSAVRLANERTDPDLRHRTHFVQGDFLQDSPPTPFDWVFEHTLFCAIDPTKRDEYVQAAHRWLVPGGYLLAVHYMIRVEQGPPFGCHQEELIERFSPRFELLQGWLPASFPNRAGRELMLWWRRKD